MSESVSLSLHEWACLRAELIWVYDQPVQPESRRREVRRASEYAVWYLREGKAVIRSGRKVTLLEPGMWYTAPTGPARQEFSDDARILSIQFRYEWPSGSRALTIRPGGLVFPGAGELLRQAQQLSRLVRRHFSLGANYRLQTRQTMEGPVFLRFHATFTAWLATWVQACLQHGAGWSRLRSGDDRALRAVRILNAAPLDQPFPREMLNRETDLSEVHLNRIFLAEFGMSTRRYWDRRRLEFAKNYLETSAMPVKEMAYRLGFRSDAHFAVWFRRFTKKRPGEWRSDSVR